MGLDICCRRDILFLIFWGAQRMVSKVESACFMIADISGYTQFLAGVALDHAHDIIADVMGMVVRKMRPAFRLAKFEGDAAFLYAVDGKPGVNIDGAMVQDAIEAVYFAFRRRLRDIRLASACECDACRQMQDLDLKFVVHHGNFIRHRMVGREELAGREVIVVHRLLKNGVNERFGRHAYALYSDACARAFGMDMAAQGLADHVEAIDIIGDVTVWVRDLEAAWRAEGQRHDHAVTADAAAIVIAFDIAAPCQKVWDYFTSPGQRPKWRATDKVRETIAAGRRGVGTVNHCQHGPDVIIEEVLDWRPFQTLTLTTLLPMLGAPKVLMSYVFESMDDGQGTHLEIRIGKPKPKDVVFLQKVGAHFEHTITDEVAVLTQILLAEAAMEPDGEAGLPDLGVLFLTEPVIAH